MRKNIVELAKNVCSDITLEFADCPKAKVKAKR
jgi:hypothetical protein